MIKVKGLHTHAEKYVCIYIYIYIYIYIIINTHTYINTYIQHTYRHTYYIPGIGLSGSLQAEPSAEIKTSGLGPCRFPLRPSGGKGSAVLDQTTLHYATLHPRVVY